MLWCHGVVMWHLMSLTGTCWSAHLKKIQIWYILPQNHQEHLAECPISKVPYASDWVSLAWVPFGTLLSAQAWHSSKYYAWLYYQGWCFGPYVKWFSRESVHTGGTDSIPSVADVGGKDKDQIAKHIWTFRVKFRVTNFEISGIIIVHLRVIVSMHKVKTFCILNIHSNGQDGPSRDAR